LEGSLPVKLVIEGSGHVVSVFDGDLFSGGGLRR
jgi:hypothetical protein